MGLRGPLPHLPLPSPEIPVCKCPYQASRQRSPIKDRAIVTSLARSKEATQSYSGARGRLGSC